MPSSCSNNGSAKECTSIWRSAHTTLRPLHVPRPFFDGKHLQTKERTLSVTQRPAQERPPRPAHSGYLPTTLLRSKLHLAAQSGSDSCVSPHQAAGGRRTWSCDVSSAPGASHSGFGGIEAACPLSPPPPACWPGAAPPPPPGQHQQRAVSWNLCFARQPKTWRLAWSHAAAACHSSVHTVSRVLSTGHPMLQGGLRS